MKTPVMLSLRSAQRYGEQEAEVLELTTEGTMEFRDGGWDISYRESALTGLEGVTTSFASLVEWSANRSSTVSILWLARYRVCLSISSRCLRSARSCGLTGW